MHATAWGVIRTTQGPVLRRSCRIICGSRYPIYRTRKFHQSSISSSIPSEPLPPKDEGAPEVSPEEVDGARVESDSATPIPVAESSSVLEPDYLALSQRVKIGGGRGRLRASRLKQPRDGLPPIVIPDWFWERNINPRTGGLSKYSETKPETIIDGEEATGIVEATGGELPNDGKFPDSEQVNGKEAPDGNVNANNSAPMRDAKVLKKYLIHQAVYEEILTSLKAGLKLRPPKNTETHAPIRPVLILQCPKDGGIGYLDSIVETASSELGADLVRMDAQDIAQIVGSYVDENLAWNSATTSLYGYNVQEAAGKLEEYDRDSSADQAEEESAEEDELPNLFSSMASVGKSKNQPTSIIHKILTMTKPLPKPEHMHFPGGGVFAFPMGQPGESIDIGRSGPSAERGRDNTSTVNWNDLKMNAILEQLVLSADKSRVEQSKTQAEQESSAKTGEEIASSIDASLETSTVRDLIIHLKDYKEFSLVPGGPDLLTKLKGLVNKKWQEGRNIILIGTSSSEQGEPALEKSEIQKLQEGDDRIESEKRIILVPPKRTEAQDTVFSADDKARIRTINIRHVEDMILKLAEGTYQPVVNLEQGLDSAIIFSAGLEDAVWSFSSVHRLATILLGMSHDTITGQEFSTALNLLYESDEAKFKWGAEEIKKEDEEVEVVLDAAESEKKNIRDKISAVKKKCNRYEQNLLSGVIFPSDIHTTFKDVHAPKETIESVKSLTSLSLLRPEAFSYGVLATDKIPGLLLYGPPGTGKTLIAKAVAKESGATVLEITGADLNNMFVGEGEKNVRAVFSLAKKLSPCVVFIDEVDSVFASRETSRQRGGQREMINQFLREWDGLNSMSAFILVATNRPFDLDDAILRRLPRRVLVDLPTEKDREEILKIHLKDEILHDDVSLSALAKDTPFYSGSDLKNLCVAAALVCIREENKLATDIPGSKPPEKRTLLWKHFEHALGEVSASISEDMSSLTAIKKFDEKYGDRKGRRKKGPSMGFGGTKTVEKDSEAARVRKSVIE